MQSLVSELDRVLDLLERGFASIKILVVGDLMLDQYILGVVDRISPEAPVPVLRHVDRYARPGGAANVALNLAGLGCQTSLAGFWGKDNERAELEKQLRAACVDVHGTIETEVPTTCKTRIIANRQQLVRLDIENTKSFTLADQQKLVQQALTLLADVNAVILSDYAKGTLTSESCGALIRAARSKGIPVLVDPKSSDFSKYAEATTICPNLAELSLATRIPADDVEELFIAADELLRRNSVEFITITRSKDGITAVKPEGRIHSQAKTREVYDVSGAGDTVIATLAAALAGDLELTTALDLANLAAGIVISKAGTVPIAAHELLSELTASPRGLSREKILTTDKLLRRVDEWRLSGEMIVFTNGCFDLLHVGHLSLFEDCARLGAKVVVGLNGDESIRRLKGPKRPIVGENERARLVAALGAVDAVTLFDEDTPLQLIEKLRPDVLVKGGDYIAETIVGYDEVLSYGGRVEIVPTVEGFSTTALVQKLTGEDHETRVVAVSGLRQ